MRGLKTPKLPRLAAPAPVCVEVRDIASSLCSEEQLLNSVGVTVTPQAPLQPPWSCEHINEIQFVFPFKYLHNKNDTQHYLLQTEKARNGRFKYVSLVNLYLSTKVH